MSGMLNLTDILQPVIYSFNHGSFPKHQLVMQVHQRVLHVLLDFCDQMYVVHK